MQKNVFLIAFSILMFSFGLAYAVNTFRVFIPETSNNGTLSRSYDSQELYIQSGSLVIINLDNDDIIENDYFSGFYHDSAYGIFYTEYSGVSGNSGDLERVSISSDTTNRCLDSSTHQGYKLSGYSYSPSFGAMDFNHDATTGSNSGTFTYICIPSDENSSLPAYLGGNAYSELIGTQNLGGIEFDFYEERSIDFESEARLVKIEGIASSQNENTSGSGYSDDIRILGNVDKSSLRKNILQNVFEIIKSAPIDNGSLNVNALGNQSWSALGNGTVLLGGKVLYFGNLGPGDVVDIAGTSNLEGVKTVVVEGGDIVINNNIRNSDNDSSDILGIIAIQKNGLGGNILIENTVTDIHAILYADRSILSSVGGAIADGSTPDSQLRNQLYIKGSIFSENTIGGGTQIPYTCPFFENSTCTESVAKKYDLSYLRRYILVNEIDVDGNPTGNQFPEGGAAESYMGDTSNTNTASQSGKSGYRVYPLVIEYNSTLQNTPPPLF